MNTNTVVDTVIRIEKGATGFVMGPGTNLMLAGCHITVEDGATAFAISERLESSSWWSCGYCGKKCAMNESSCSGCGASIQQSDRQDEIRFVPRVVGPRADLSDPPLQFTISVEGEDNGTR